MSSKESLSINIGDNDDISIMGMIESYPNPVYRVSPSLANKIFLMDYSTGIAGTFFGSSRDNNRISEE